MLRRSTLHRRVPRPDVRLDRLAPVLWRLGVDPERFPTAPLVPAPTAKEQARGATVGKGPKLSPPDALAPLFTPYFAFEDRQYMALGDATIAGHLTEVVSRFALYRGLAMSANVAKELVACFHNAAAMRFLAEQLGLPDLAIIDPRDAPADGDENAAMAHVLNQLREPPLEPGLRDVAGTSFDFRPVAAAPSVWGQRLSHLIGAIRLHMGSAAAEAAVATMYGLPLEDAEEVNLPHRAAQFLTQVVAASSAPVVVEAMLAAQGLTPNFAVRSVPLPVEASAAPSSATQTGDGEVASEEGPRDAEEPTAATSNDDDPLDSVAPVGATDDAPVAASAGASPAVNDETTALGLAMKAAGAPPGTAHPLATALADSEALRSLAAGPGVIDAIGLWKKRQEQRAAADTSLVSTSDGWLKDPREGEGPSSGRYMRFASVARGDAYFADIVGTPEPLQGAHAAYFPQLLKVKDDAFGSVVKGKDGIEVETFGMSAAEYVRSFRTAPAPVSDGDGNATPATPRRVFEVSLVLRGPDGSPGVTAARAVDRRFTRARVAAATGYLEGVMIDLSRVAAGAASPPSSSQ